jgi:hypothetical protein
VTIAQPSYPTTTSSLVTYVGSYADFVSGYNVVGYGATGDGSTDDTTAIAAALTAAASTGGTAYFPRGIYMVAAATLAVPSNVRWVGDGQGASIIRLKSGANGRLLSQTSTQSNVEFRDLTFDFNAINQTDGAVRDDRSGHFLSNITGLRYINCEITGGRSGAALRLDGCNRTLILGNYFHDNGFATLLNGAVTLPATPITVVSTTGFAASGQIMVGDNQLVTYTGKTSTTFTGCTGGTGTVPTGTAVIPAVSSAAMMSDHNFNSNADGLRVVGNTYERATDTGTAQDGIQHSTVTGNVYLDNILAASISNSTTRNSRFNTITGNTVRGGDRYRTSVGFKVSTFGSPTPGNLTDGVISGNQVHGCDRALWVEECNRMTITGNTLGERGTNSSNGQVILLGSSGTNSDVKIASNIIHDTTNRGISFAGTNNFTNVDIEDNAFVTVTTPLGGTIPTSTRILNNRGLNATSGAALFLAVS